MEEILVIYKELEASIWLRVNIEDFRLQNWFDGYFSPQIFTKCSLNIYYIFLNSLSFYLKGFSRLHSDSLSFQSNYLRFWVRLFENEVQNSSYYLASPLGVNFTFSLVVLVSMPGIFTILTVKLYPYRF